ncbi:MAG: hypothetical protein M3357_07080 [Actinomycetota bacterium]|nr:hypothetical protein [Actinomycetota bacterium]
MNFYDEVLRELLVALGAALFLGNLLALIRRRPPATLARETEDSGEQLPLRAPIGRTVVYLLLGLVVMVWGIASLAAA